MPKIIGLREFREKVSDYARQVQKGQSFIVVRQSKPLFKITAIDDEADIGHQSYRPRRTWEEVEQELDWIASGGKQKTNLAKFIHDDRRRH